MAPVRKAELSPGAWLTVDAMTRARRALYEAATPTWIRLYANGLVVFISGHLLSGAS